MIDEVLQPMRLWEENKYYVVIKFKKQIVVIEW